MATNPRDYVNLRTMLDSLEVGALRYYLSGSDLSQPKKFDYLLSKLKPLIDELWDRPARIKPPLADPCPPGYYNCDGMCVPYECPSFIGGPKPRKPTKKPAKRKR
jgi:hypothetical protein